MTMYFPFRPHWLPDLLDELTSGLSYFTFSKHNAAILSMLGRSALGPANCEQTCLHCTASTDKP